MQSSPVLKIHPKDTIAVALDNLQKGDKVTINGERITLKEAIQIKHKFSLIDLKQHSKIYMYGVLVGQAKKNIPQGGLISTENTVHKTTKVTRKTKTIRWEGPDISVWKNKTFMGYHRNDGQVGTKNIWLFFPLVFCENRNIELLKKIFESELNPPKKEPLQYLLSDLIHQGQSKKRKLPLKPASPVFENVELRFITHQGGCGGTREDSETLARLLAGYVNNPNVVGATVLSLGCQHLQIDLFKEHLHDINSKFDKPLLFFEQQSEGTVDSLLSRIIKKTFYALKKANTLKRAAAPLSKLTIGLECGGSDGFSGITANPTLGNVSDLISALGGKAILSEFPELSGVEQELVNRCTNTTISKKFLKLMQDYEAAAARVGSGFDRNPSPGNIKDGLITDAIKSAGAAKKGGSSPINDVLDYTEYVKMEGVSLLNSPGNDVESTTAMAGSGANIILFTTGLGTPTGNPITPVIKVSTNTDLANKMPDIIDFDCGEIITKKRNIEAMGTELLDYIVQVASGEISTKATTLDQHDFIPWKRGVSL